VAYTVRFFKDQTEIGTNPFVSREVAIRHARQLPIIRKSLGATSAQVTDEAGNVVYVVPEALNSRP
jgi:hypothetical protein